MKFILKLVFFICAIIFLVGFFSSISNKTQNNHHTETAQPAQIPSPLQKNDPNENLPPENPITEKTEKSNNPLITYNGKERSANWFNYCYKNYADNIVMVNGSYRDVNPASCKTYQFKVIQIIGDDQILADLDDQTYHLSGCGNSLTDNEYFTFKGFLLKNENFSYTSVLGAQTTVKSFTLVPQRSLSRDEFKKALESGVKIYQFTKSGKKLVP